VSVGFLKTAALSAAGNVNEWKRRYGHQALTGIHRQIPFLPDSWGGCGIIAEVKRRSPSRGDLMEGSDPERFAGLYQEAGAEAVSVVVEEKHFGGSPDLFERVRARTELPLLWKDFVIDPYQIHLAAALGASAILLIVGLVPDGELRSFIHLARESGLSSLVEIHREEELGRALSAGADIVGVNNRNLVSLEVDTSTSERIAPLFPSGLRTVAESGTRGPEDVRRMAGLGYRAVLVGEALVTAGDPESLLEEMVKAGRRERRV
jgi:indole-3-glycerol phosphate synthase